MMDPKIDNQAFEVFFDIKKLDSISFEIDGSEKLNMGSYTQFNQ